MLPYPGTISRPLGSDVGQGSADNWGYADEPAPGFGAPLVYVFDHTSDSATCAALGISDPQFGVGLVYQGVATSALAITGPITPTFDAMVRAFKGPGFPPVY